LEYTDEELLEIYRTSGVSQRDLAIQLGMPFNKLHGKIFRAQKREEAEGKVEFEGDDNHQIITVHSHRIHTLEELLQFTKVDLDKWKVERYLVNKWEVGAKDMHGNIVVEPLYQVKAWLVIKNPVAVYPVISPVVIDRQPRKQVSRGLIPEGRVLHLADPHFGYVRRNDKLIPMHSEPSLDAALEIASSFDFSHITIAGDLLDLPEWTDKFLRSPDLRDTTQPAIQAASVWLDNLCTASPDSEIIILEGNHDKRLRDYLIKHLYQAYDLRSTSQIDDQSVMSVPYLLDLKNKGIRYIGDYPRGEFWVSNTVRAIHGHVVRSKSGQTAAAVVGDSHVTTLFGHIHRIELASKTVYDSEGARYIYAFCSGCLCRTDGIVPSSSAQENWQNGVGIINFDGNSCMPIGIPITNGTYIKEI